MSKSSNVASAPCHGVPLIFILRLLLHSDADVTAMFPPGAFVHGTDVFGCSRSGDEDASRPFHGFVDRVSIMRIEERPLTIDEMPLPEWVYARARQPVRAGRVSKATILAAMDINTTTQDERLVTLKVHLRPASAIHAFEHLDFRVKRLQADNADDHVEYDHMLRTLQHEEEGTSQPRQRRYALDKSITLLNTSFTKSFDYNVFKLRTSGSLKITLGFELSLVTGWSWTLTPYVESAHAAIKGSAAASAAYNAELRLNDTDVEKRMNLISRSGLFAVYVTILGIPVHIELEVKACVGIVLFSVHHDSLLFLFPVDS